ncbi:MAG: hypothetical protein AAGA70_06995 [Pseudomonadota bacterium]
MTLVLADLLPASGNPADVFGVPDQGLAFHFATKPELWSRLLAFIRRDEAGIKRPWLSLCGSN